MSGYIVVYSTCNRTQTIFTTPHHYTTNSHRNTGCRRSHYKIIRFHHCFRTRMSRGMYRSIRKWDPNQGHLLRFPHSPEIICGAIFENYLTWGRPKHFGSLDIHQNKIVIFPKMIETQPLTIVSSKLSPEGCKLLIWNDTNKINKITKKSIKVVSKASISVLHQLVTWIVQEL